MSDCKHEAGFGPTAICCYCQESASNVTFSMQARIEELERSQTLLLRQARDSAKILDALLVIKEALLQENKE